MSDITSSRAIEYRVVCANYPGREHSRHITTKRDLERAEQAVRDNDHHSEMMQRRRGRHWYAGEAPFRVQTREVTEWEDLDMGPIIEALI